jgi:DNA repair protein RadC
MTAAQKTAKAKFKQAIAYRTKTGVSLKEAFAHVYGKKVGAAPKKKATKKAAPKKAAKKVVKKTAPKKVAKKKIGDFVRKGTKFQEFKKTTTKKHFKGADYLVDRTKSGKFLHFSKLSGTNKLPSEFVSLSGYKETKEIVLGSIGKLKSIEKLIPEVKVRITRGKSVINDQIRSSKDSATIFKKFIGKDKIQTQEFFAVMYLSQSNKVIGVYVHSMGSINATSADVRLILGGALRVGAVSLIICHNHPSGNMQPSEADIQLTKKLIAAAKYHDIRVLDHIIIGKDNQFSFADNNLI